MSAVSTAVVTIEGMRRGPAPAAAMGSNTAPEDDGVGAISNSATTGFGSTGWTCTLMVPRSWCSSSAMSFSLLNVIKSPSLSS